MSPPLWNRATGRAAGIGARAVPCCMLLAVLGCGGQSKATFKNCGTILDAQRRPAAGAIVILQPKVADADVAARPTATVAEDGSYRLTTFTTEDGIPEGEYAVTVLWPAARKTPFEPPGGDRLGGAVARVGPASPRIRVTREPNQSAAEIVPSHHLRVLRHAGIVSGRKQGRFVHYTLRKSMIATPVGKDGRQVLDLGCCQLQLPRRRLVALSTPT